MKKITIEDVRNILANQGNMYVSTLTNEELNQAILQDDLGLQDYEIIELMQQLEVKGRFFFAKPAETFLKNTSSIPVYLLRRICNDYTVESKPCYP